MIDVHDDDSERVIACHGDDDAGRKAEKVGEFGAIWG